MKQTKENYLVMGACKLVLQLHLLLNGYRLVGGEVFVTRVRTHTTEFAPAWDPINITFYGRLSTSHPCIYHKPGYLAAGAVKTQICVTHKIGPLVRVMFHVIGLNRWRFENFTIWDKFSHNKWVWLESSPLFSNTCSIEFPQNPDIALDPVYHIKTTPPGFSLSGVIVHEIPTGRCRLRFCLTACLAGNVHCIGVNLATLPGGKCTCRLLGGESTEEIENTDEGLVQGAALVPYPHE